MTTVADPRAALARFDAAIAGEDAEAMAAIFAAEYPILEALGEMACALATYVETAEERRSGVRTVLHGRAVYFLGRDAGDGWRLTLALSSLAQPPAEVA